MRDLRTKLNRVLAVVLTLLLTLVPVQVWAAQGVTVSLPVANIVQGDMVDGEAEPFLYTLTPVTEGAPMPDGGETLTIEGSGNGAFTDLIYSHAGEYVYRIQETAGTAQGYAYDGMVYTVTVHVTDHAGRLEAAVTVEAGGEKFPGILFVNTYTNPTLTPPENTGSLVISNAVIGALADNDKQFTFTVQFLDSDGLPLGDSFPYTGYGVSGGLISSYGTGEGNGNFLLSHGQSIVIHNLPIGTHFVVVEQEANQDGLITSVQSATGSIMPMGNVSAWQNYLMGPGDPDPVQVTFTAGKTLDGGAPSGSQFTFLLRDVNGRVMQSVQNEGENIVFAPVTLMESGDYTYYLSELPGNGAYTYDATVYTVTVHVVQEGLALRAEIQYDGESQRPTFVNTTASSGGGGGSGGVNPGDSGDSGDTVTMLLFKVWDDQNNAEGKRPDQITAQIFRDGELVKSVSLNVENGWEVALTLPADGTYTASEVKVEGYFGFVMPFEGNFVLMNRQVIAENALTGTEDISGSDGGEASDFPGWGGEDNQADGGGGASGWIENLLHGNTPVTGDTGMTMLWGIILGVSGLGLAVSLWLSCRKKRGE